MRKNEILNLRWNDVDFLDAYIHIRESKTNMIRKVPMNSVVTDVLKGIDRKDEFIFYSEKTGTRLRDFFRSFKSVCIRAGIVDFRFHDLRHTVATLMVMGGIDLATVSQILGHSSIKMTMKYAHPIPENKRRAVDILASVFETKKQRNMDINRSYEHRDVNTTLLLTTN